jgi:anhydro-N-acetylmuramic acid kinase
VKKNRFRVLGVMSGTSLDGIDLALIDFWIDPWKFNLVKTATIPYPDQWIKILTNIYYQGIKKIHEVDNSYTVFLGDIVRDFINKNQIKDIDFVSSHGHTAMHIPSDGITYQLGNLSSINQKYNLTTICDFRNQDVELGGQGAPLVPIGDVILFSDYTACLNLGGFANISREIQGKRIAYDICSVNLVFNYLARKKFLLYDKNGELAKSGKLLTKLFDELNEIDFYNLSYPKSLGIEWNVSIVYPIIIEALKKSSLEDVIHTYLKHVVLKISDCLNDDDKVLVSGGGALNQFLIETLKSKTKAEIIVPSRDLIEYKEALIFGLLGLLRVLDINNCLSSVTGASKDHCSGKIFKMKP